MPKRVHKISATQKRHWGENHRFEHWYAGNQVYFITARCSDRFPAFASEEAKRIFWDRFDHYTSQCQFTPWVISLIPNHYHIVGYCREGRLLGQMMRKLHGSVAKLVNDILDERRVPFWAEAGHQDYFDGCIRNEVQCGRAYRYTLTQSVRHGICARWQDYPDTHVNVELDRGVRRALEIGAFLVGVPYKRYQRATCPKA